MNKRDVFLINCKVISQLKPHMRINTSSELFRTHSVRQWIPTWVARWWLAQSRERDIVRIHQMFEEMLNESPEDQMRKAIQDALQGLVHLKLTYADDTTVVAQIDVIMEMIERALAHDGLDE